MQLVQQRMYGSIHTRVEEIISCMQFLLPYLLQYNKTHRHVEEQKFLFAAVANQTNNYYLIIIK